MIALREPTAEDLRLMLIWINQESVRRFSRGREITKEDHKIFTDRVGKDPYMKAFTILLDDTPVGACRIDYATFNSGEFSIYFDVHHQHKGHGTEALNLLMDVAFSNPDTNIFWGTTHPHNFGAHRLFEKCGLNAMKTVFTDNKVDWLRYIIGRDKWARLRSSSAS